MDEKNINHLQMVQEVIKRMASNSFSLKGWAVSLVAGIFALSSKESDKMYFLVAYIPCIIFWGLDAYYLRQERLFRALYDMVRLKHQPASNFSMDTSICLDDKSLSEDEKKKLEEKLSYFDSFFSTTELWFYIPLLVASTIVILLNNWEKAISIITQYWLPIVTAFLLIIFCFLFRKKLYKTIKKIKNKKP